MSPAPQSRHTRWANALLLVALFLIFLLPRWLVAGQTATIDETKWVARAANFSLALSTGNLAATFQSEHPGVTTMWAGSLGLKGLLPDYAAQAPGQLEPYELDQVLLAQGYTPLEALTAGRRVMILFNALVLLLVFLYARRLLDLQTAVLAAVFSALSPFFAAHSHLMHLDGLASSLMLLSLLAFLTFAEWRKLLDLLLSGAAAGLAWLTKTPALSLGPILLIIVVILILTGRERREPGWEAARRPLLSLFAWSILGTLTFVLFWPAMWVEPLYTVERILGEALSYAGGGHGDPVFFNGVIYADGRIPSRVFYYYPLTFLWRSTPVVLLGLPLAILALWRRWSPLDRRVARQTILALALYALLFAFFMTLGGKKFDRYLIPIYPALHLVTAAGWVGLVRQIGRRWFSDAAQRPLLIVLLLALIGWQFLDLRSAFPYYLSYYNPLPGGSERAPGVMQIGWGEGMDAAGRYLSGKQEGESLAVASWYRSALAYYFDGETISINAELSPEAEAAIRSADYVVLYIHQWQRDVPPTLLDELAAREPEHIVEINGLEYARIYNLQPLDR